jgi:hypothetical protein
MQLKSTPKDSYGTFFKGDTYLIYFAQETKSVITEQHVFLWIGSESSQVIKNIFFNLYSFNSVKFCLGFRMNKVLELLKWLNLTIILAVRQFNIENVRIMNQRDFYVISNNTAE